MKGPWPAPVADRVEPVALSYADRFPAWGHRKIAMLMRVDGHHRPHSTVLRALKRTGRVLPVDYQAERRQLAQYEHLYRLEIDDGHTLGIEVEAYRQLFTGSHRTKRSPYAARSTSHLETINDRQTTKSNEPETMPTP